MRNFTTLLFFFLAVIIGCKSTGTESSDDGILYLTTFDQQIVLERLEGRIISGDSSSGNNTIEIDPSETYQEMDGFGYSLTGGSAYHINNMDDEARAAILKELFGSDDQDLNVSYLRVSIGASDLDFEPFSYNDLPTGETDTDLSEFSLDPDREHLIPVLKEILEINPDLKIMGSPWSAPSWMKTNKSTIGGSLMQEYYSVYAQYFVKYVQGMEEEGITLDAITIQNEPQHGGNNPSMVMSAIEQRDFIKNHLGPAFSDAGIETKIIIWDHNADRPDYPITILNDEDARVYVDGSAFHLYGGDISALSTVKEAHPDKNLYFTEQWIGAPGNFSADIAWHTRNLIIGATRNWSKNVLQWNLAADENEDPHTDGGCDRCLGALTIRGDQVTRNPAYYIIAQVSKFVDTGSVRIESSEVNNLRNVAFKNTEGDIVVVILNESNQSETIDISIENEFFTTTIRARSVATLIL